MFFWYSWDNSKQNMGLLDGRFCSHCGKNTVHSLIRHHKHFMFIIPFYISNKYYSVCHECDTLTLIDKNEAKKTQYLNHKYFKKEEKFDEFLGIITTFIQNSGIITNYNSDSLANLKNQVFEHFKDVYAYDKSFYDSWVDYLINDLKKDFSIDEIANKNESSLEDKLKELKNLYDQNLISEEEYTLRKRELLNL